VGAGTRSAPPPFPVDFSPAPADWPFANESRQSQRFQYFGLLPRKKRTYPEWITPTDFWRIPVFRKRRLPLRRRSAFGTGISQNNRPNFGICPFSAGPTRKAAQWRSQRADQGDRFGWDREGAEFLFFGPLRESRTRPHWNSFLRLPMVWSAVDFILMYLKQRRPTFILHSFRGLSDFV